MVGRINNFFVKADKVCDYIPYVSSVSNITDIFQKCVVLPFLSEKTINNNHYYKSLKQKPILRCVVLLIPIIGNISVAIYDFVNKDKKSKVFTETSAIKSEFPTFKKVENLNNSNNINKLSRETVNKNLEIDHGNLENNPAFQCGQNLGFLLNINSSEEFVGELCVFLDRYYFKTLVSVITESEASKFMYQLEEYFEFKIVNLKFQEVKPKGTISPENFKAIKGSLHDLLQLYSNRPQIKALISSK